MAVQARFTITEIVKYGYVPGEPSGKVTLKPDIGSDNLAWAKYTPAGEIWMNVNGPGLPWFEENLGKTVAITFDDVPAEPDV